MRQSAIRSSKVLLGELVVITFSRSLLGVASGILFLCALATIGFYAAHGDQQDGSSNVGGNRPLSLNSTSSTIPDSEMFVLKQEMGGGGFSRINGQWVAKELIIQNWEKPNGPVPSWLAIGSGEEPNERELAIRRAFDKRIDVDFKETRLADVLHTIGDKLGIPVIIDVKGLENETVTEDEPVTVARKDARVRDILRQILQPLYLTVKVDLEALVITNLKEAIEVRYYDLSHILPDNGVTVDLINAIETSIYPDQWANAGGTGTMFTVGSVLIVNSPQETHDGIENLLRAIGKQNANNLKPRLFKYNYPIQPAVKGSEAPSAGAINNGIPQPMIGR